MDIVMNIITTLATWLRDYLSIISLSFVATALVIYGNTITLLIRKQIGSLQFFLKVTLFILLCAFGFAFITSFLTPLLAQSLGRLDDLWLTIAIILGFYGLGFLAQKKGMI